MTITVKQLFIAMVVFSAIGTACGVTLVNDGGVAAFVGTVAGTLGFLICAYQTKKAMS